MTTRRDFLAVNLIGAAGLAANPVRMFSAPAESGPTPATPHPVRSDRNFWSDWPAYLTAEMNQARNRRLAELASIHSTAQLQERITVIRSKLWELIGGIPEKTPLNPRVTGTMDRGPYRIENIVFESFPKVYVTANLYLPTSGKGPYPAILAPVGHSENGKAYHYYQHLYQNLVRQGYVVLAYDPFGQGERLQYIDPKTGRSLYGPVGEHEQAGRPMVLMGESFALYCAWDGIRGLDYLVSRPEVDAARLGCTGQSGGGTMTMYLAALESRLRAAVVSDGNSENVAGPFFDPPGATDDAEQNIVGSLPLGIDRGDLLLAFAPKPLLICYTTHDEGVTYSPVYEESTEDIYRELQRVYGLLGAKDHVGLFASHLPHGLDFFNRSATYTWFNRWLENPTPETGEAELDRFPEERLNATSTGQVSTSIGGRSVVQLNTDRARIAIEKSPFQNASMNAASIRAQAKKELTELLALPQQRSSLHSRIRSTNPRKNVVIEEIQFESEPGMRVPGWFVAPLSTSSYRSTILYLTDDGGDDVVAEPGSMDRLLAAGHAVCAITLRGLGISLPRFPRGGPNYYGGEVHLDQRFAWTCLVMGRPVIGQRVWDTMRAIDYLASRPDVDLSQIRIVGVGSSGLTAMMAALLDHRVRSVLVDRTLASYASILESESYSLKLAWFVPGILRKFDLPQIAAALSPRPCWILNGVDANGQVLSESSVREQSRGVNKEMPVPTTLHYFVRPEGDVQESYLEWLKTT
ncbi:MAG: alpha/beta hydrolase family protein [Acidobacteriaceae bacterium]